MRLQYSLLDYFNVDVNLDFRWNQPFFKVNLNLIGKLFLDISFRNVYSEIVQLNNEIILRLKRIAVEYRLSLILFGFSAGQRCECKR